jgi:hypothetical protein
MLRAAIILSLSATFAAGADDALRAALEMRLSAMESAVLAADPAAYMASIAPGDPEFTFEQRHWADDLALHKPERFDLEIKGEDAPVLAADTAETLLSMTWQMPASPERKVEFPARFVLSEGSWLYAGEVWTMVEGEGVRALCAAGLEDEAREAARAFPEVRAHVQEGFELTIDRVQVVKLYASMEHLQASIYLSYTDGLGGWNEPGESIKILASRHMGARGYRSLLAHEFGHVCTFEMGPHATNMPWWALEGVAELASEHFSRSDPDRFIRSLVAEGRLGDWEKMSDFRKVAERDYALVYPQGHHMVSYLSERWGRAARNAWLRAMAQGRTIDDASREALGLSFADLDAQWRASLRAPAPEPAPTAAPESPQEPK